jgi:hypothetical protein
MKLNEVYHLIIYCLNCIRRDQNSTYKTGLTWNEVVLRSNVLLRYFHFVAKYFVICDLFLIYFNFEIGNRTSTCVRDIVSFYICNGGLESRPYREILYIWCTHIMCALFCVYCMSIHWRIPRGAGISIIAGADIRVHRL